MTFVYTRKSASCLLFFLNEELTAVWIKKDTNCFINGGG